MPQPQQYQRIAERYAEAAALINANVPEASAFASYHAFESTGCAWIRHCNQTVPLSPHTAKINLFVRLARGFPFSHGAATLTATINALRNKMLYPIRDGSGGYVLPEAQMSASNARDLLRRVRGIMRKVQRNL